MVVFYRGGEVSVLGPRALTAHVGGSSIAPGDLTGGRPWRESPVPIAWGERAGARDQL